MGRFRHEAVAVDPQTGIVYQIEDGLLYRFIPNAPGNLRLGGRLEALCLRDHPGACLRNWSVIGGQRSPLDKNMQPNGQQLRT